MKEKTFEQAMKELEQIVQELETGEMPLEEAIKKFEEGVRLSKLCSEKLDQTEKRISILLRDQEGNVFEKPFPDESGSKKD